MVSRRVTRIQKKNGKKLVERGFHKCAICHVASRGWAYVGVIAGDIWAECPKCKRGQVVGEVR